MNAHQLSQREMALLDSVFHRHPEIARVVLFGSRAKGSARPNSDIDLAVDGSIDTLQVQALADELDQLPLPYQFDVQAINRLQNPQLRAHIDRVGIEIYRAPPAQAAGQTPFTAGAEIRQNKQ